MVLLSIFFEKNGDKSLLDWGDDVVSQRHWIMLPGFWRATPPEVFDTDKILKKNTQFVLELCNITRFVCNVILNVDLFNARYWV